MAEMKGTMGRQRESPGGWVEGGRALSGHCESITRARHRRSLERDRPVVEAATPDAAPAARGVVYGRDAADGDLAVARRLCPGAACLPVQQGELACRGNRDSARTPRLRLTQPMPAACTRATAYDEGRAASEQSAAQHAGSHHGVPQAHYTSMDKHRRVRLVGRANVSIRTRAAHDNGAPAVHYKRRECRFNTYDSASQRASRARAWPCQRQPRRKAGTSRCSRIARFD